MARNQLVLIHGYSDEGSSFEGWRKALAARGYDVTALSACNYKTLTNEVTIKDIAEGFDRALSLRVGLGPDEPFEAIVHSTGMLVIRAWLTTYERRRGRLKRLIGLAPASFGSPLAHKGRSWLGSVFKGNKEYGPDFLEAGDLVLDGLELGSRYTWDLAHRDLLGEKAFYGSTDETPYVFVFCGNRAYGGFSLRRLVNEPGTDGTVRWAGCALDTRKITLDLTVDPARDPELSRFRFAPWSNVRIPLHLVDGLNHGTILTTPSEELIDIVDRALQVDSEDKLAEVQAAATAMHERAKAALGQDGGFAEWQQFVIRVTDERGDPVPDYNIQLVTYVDGQEILIDDFSLDVHAYTTDPSFRCFHLNLSELDYQRFERIWMKLMASSGSTLVGYWGYGYEADERGDPRVERGWDAQLEITELLRHPDVELFRPFTTTLVEITLNREPIPFEREKISELVGWWQWPDTPRGG